VHQTLRQALIWLAAREEVDKQKYEGHDLDCREQVQSRHGFNPIQDNSLQILFERSPDTGELHAWDTWLFLPAPKKGKLRIPVLNVIYDYEKSSPAVSLQTAIFYPDPGTGDPLATGWRFESPGQDGEATASMHGYCHVQPCHGVRTLKQGDRDLPGVNTTVPQGEPAFPLDAADEVDLLVCLLLSIYGLREGAELIRAAGEPDLSQRLALLRGDPRRRASRLAGPP
jgi:hypothetical protein